MSFPDGFLWGTATAAHQVEGDNRASDWWEAEQRGLVPQRSGAACRQWERFADDLDLARSLHLNAQRFSVEWSRIEPKEGVFDEQALAHYAAVVAACRARGLEPVVTLHHFTNPLWFARAGGWLARGAPERFARHAARVAAALDVRRWLTLNEPTVLAVHGWVLGEWPPFEKRAWGKAWRVLRAMARAHVLARRAILRARPGALVGYAHSAPFVVPCDPTRARDRLAARLRDHVWNEAFPRRIAAEAGGERALDFLGLNYYTRTLTRSTLAGGPSGLLLGRACHAEHHADRGPLSAVGQEVHPAGLTAVLERFAGLGVPLYVTENGVATDDEALRRSALRGHLEALQAALGRGVDVRGYFYWSLVDNFEWRHGTDVRYGLFAVDFATQERNARPVARDYAEVCRTGRLPVRPADAAEAGGTPLTG